MDDINTEKCFYSMNEKESETTVCTLSIYLSLTLTLSLSLSHDLSRDVINKTLNIVLITNSIA